MGYYILDESQLQQGFGLCINKSIRLLNDAQLLLENGGDPLHALGLYSFALEEYGKALLLRDSRLVKDRRYVPKRIFGRGEKSRKAHEEKFSKALQDLPDSCVKIPLTLYVQLKHNVSEKSQTFRFSYKNQTTSVSVPGHTTGLFEDISGLDLIVDFVARQVCFYMDWDDEGKSWTPPIIPYPGKLHAGKLRDAVSDFKAHLTGLKNAM